MKKATHYILLSILFIIIVFRFISMWHMPDVFSDEQIILDHMDSIIKTGHDTDGNFMPLFPRVGGGVATYTYLYPMIFFLYFIGVSAVKARFIQQLFTIVACLLTAYGMRFWTKNTKIFWITLFSGLTLPWGFVQANRIWDPSFVPFYFGAYFFFFSLLMKKTQQTQKETYFYSVAAFSFLVLLAIVYPPARIPAVAMWIYSFLWATHERKLSKSHMMTIVAVSTLFALPLAINLLNPEFNARSAFLLIFFQEKLTRYQQLFIILESIAELFSPLFLFVGGDMIYRHSLPIFGMLGPLSVIPIISLLRQKKMPPLATYMFFTIIATYFSVSLTYDYQPHSLRSCLAWLPFVVLLSFGWANFLENKSKNQHTAWFLLTASQFILYFISYISIHHGIISF